MIIYHGLSLIVLLGIDLNLSAIVTSVGKEVEDKNNKVTGVKNPFSRQRARKEILLCEDGAKEQTLSVSV